MVKIARIVLLCMLLAMPASFTLAADSTLVFWHWYSEDRLEALLPLFEQFEAETNIKIEPQLVVWEDIPEKLALAVAAGVPPDVTAISSDRGVPLLVQGTYADLRPFMAKESPALFEDLLPNSLEMWQTPDGAQLAYPFDLDIAGLYYNIDLFAQMGMAVPDAEYTWEKTLESAKRLTIDTDGDGRYNQHGLVTGFILPDTLVWAYGGELLNADGTNHGLGSAGGRAGIEMWREINQPEVNLDWGDAPSFGFASPPDAFAAGKVAMIPIGAWGPSVYWQDPATKRFFVDFDVTFMPQAQGHERAVAMAGQGVGIVAASNQQEAAWEFVKFMASEPVQTVSAKDLGQFPVLRSVALSDAFIVPGQPPANAHVIIESTMYARSRPLVRNWPEAWAHMLSQIGTFVVGAQPLGNVIQTLDETVPAILAR